MAPPRRALIAVSSAHAPLYSDGRQTGMWVGEALHPFNVFTDAGFEVNLVSEKGSYSADQWSETKDWLTDEEIVVWKDPNSAFRKKLDEHLKPADFKAEDYGIIFFSAGHAALIDYPDAKGLHNIAIKIYTEGAIVSAVCHGPAVFTGIIDPSTGKSIINGKRITGFTDRGENEENIMGIIKSWGHPTVEEAAAICGATYVSPKGPWDDFHLIDGRIVTGANPASAKSTAEAAVKAYEAL